MRWLLVLIEKRLCCLPSSLAWLLYYVLCIYSNRFTVFYDGVGWLHWMNGWMMMAYIDDGIIIQSSCYGSEYCRSFFWWNPRGIARIIFSQDGHDRTSELKIKKPHPLKYSNTTVTPATLFVPKFYLLTYSIPKWFFRYWYHSSYGIGQFILLWRLY